MYSQDLEAFTCEDIDWTTIRDDFLEKDMKTVQKIWKIQRNEHIDNFCQNIIEKTKSL